MHTQYRDNQTKGPIWNPFMMRMILLNHALSMCSRAPSTRLRPKSHNTFSLVLRLLMIQCATKQLRGASLREFRCTLPGNVLLMLIICWGQ